MFCLIPQFLKARMTSVLIPGSYNVMWIGLYFFCYFRFSFSYSHWPRLFLQYLWMANPQIYFKSILISCLIIRQINNVPSINYDQKFLNWQTIRYIYKKIWLFQYSANDLHFLYWNIYKFLPSKEIWRPWYLAFLNFPQIYSTKIQKTTENLTG